MNTDRTEGVAVIVAAKDAGATIARAVRSALAQSLATEVVVVDDGSIDGTSAIARAADDGSGRLRVIRLDENRGPSAARNVALDSVTAPFVCILDADDLMQPNRLAKLMTQRDGADAVADDLLLADEGHEDQPFDCLVGSSRELPAWVSLEEFIEANSGAGPARRELGFLKPVISRAFLEANRLRYDERTRLGEDYLLYARLLAAGGRLRLAPACGYISVQRPGSLSHNHTAHDLRTFAQGAAELERLPGLSARERALVRRHVQRVMLKLDHRLLLQAKGGRDWRGAFAALTRSPASTPYVAGQIVKDKLAAFRARSHQNAIGSAAWAPTQG